MVLRGEGEKEIIDMEDKENGVGRSSSITDPAEIDYSQAIVLSPQKTGGR